MSKELCFAASFPESKWSSTIVCTDMRSQIPDVASNLFSNELPATERELLLARHWRTSLEFAEANNGVVCFALLAKN